MAGRFAGQTFVTCSNNGVTALAHINTREHFRLMNLVFGFLRASGYPEAANRFWQEFARKGGPIFTFVDVNRFWQHRDIYSGDPAMLESALIVIEAEDGVVGKSGLYVPFSNGAEIGHQGEDAKARELVWLTKSDEFIELLYGRL